MKNTKRILSLVLTLLMIVTAMPLTLIGAEAQECAWSYIIDGEDKTSAVNAGSITGLSVEGNYLVMNNYTGESVAAIPGGSYGDDDAPVLRIKLIGTNKLTGSEIDGIIAALYAEPRAGGSGADSRIEITGTGTLNIAIKKNKATENIYGIYANELNISGGTVNVDVIGRGATGTEVAGVKAATTKVLSSAVLDVNIYATTYVYGKAGTIISVTKSTCNTYGVDGNIAVIADNGYFSVNTKGNVSTGECYCVNGKVSFDGATDYLRTAVYLISGNDNLAKDGCVPIDTGIKYLKRSFKNTDATTGATTLNYEAYGPSTVSAFDCNNSLESLDINALASLLKISKIGETKVHETAYTEYDAQHVYARQCTYKTNIDADQAYGSSTWSELEVNDNGDCYQFVLDLYSMPGYWCNAGAGNLTMAALLNAFDYEPDAELSFVNNYRIGAGYIYSYIDITAQPQAIGCDSSSISVTATNGGNELTYEWFMDVYKNADDTAPAATISMTDFDEMEYGFTGQTDSTMNLGTLEYDETVKGCDFTYGQAASLKLYCKITGVADIVTTNKVAYEPFGTVEITGQPANAMFVNSSATLSVKATGEGLSYQWYLNNTLINASNANADYFTFTGYNTNTLTATYKNKTGLSILTENNADFTCKVTNKYGKNVTSDAATLSKPHEHVYTGAVKDNGDGTHSFKCTGCDDYGAAAAHTWNDGEITTKATCNVEGVKTYTCTVCNATKTEPIEKLEDHVWNAGEITTKATCAKAGVKTYTCTVCNTTKTEPIEKSEDHVWNDGVITTKATCAKEGVKTYTCTVCNTTKTEAIAKVAHTYKTTTTAATLTKNGKTVKECSVCGYAKSTTTIYKIKTVKLSKTSYTYTGKAFKPTVTVKDSAGKTVATKYYTVTYKNNTNAGTATVTVKFKGNYSGTKALTFKINPSETLIKTVKLSKTAYTYTGKALKPTVTVKDTNGKVIKATYYTVTYKNNKNVGKATVTVKFKGNYSGTKTLTFKINPKATTVSKVTSPKKATAKVTVKKQATQTTGYEIQYSTSSKFTAKTTKTVKITSPKTLAKTITKLSSGKTYYFRVRTYKTVSKVNYTSAWSTSVKTKIK